MAPGTLCPPRGKQPRQDFLPSSWCLSSTVEQAGPWWASPFGFMTPRAVHRCVRVPTPVLTLWLPRGLLRQLHPYRLEPKTSRRGCSTKAMLGGEFWSSAARRTELPKPSRCFATHCQQTTPHAAFTTSPPKLHFEAGRFTLSQHFLFERFLVLSTKHPPHGKQGVHGHAVVAGPFWLSSRRRSPPKTLCGRDSESSIK